MNRCWASFLASPIFQVVPLQLQLHRYESMIAFTTIVLFLFVFSLFSLLFFSFVKETRARLNGDYVTARRRTLYTYVYEVNPCENGAPFEVNI